MDFEQYVTERRRALFRFAVVLCGDPVLADDLLAQVLSVVYERWATVSSVEHVHAYVRRMLVNEYLGRRRRDARVSVRHDIAELADQTSSQPDHADGIAERELLVAELARLPRQQRAAVVLRFYEGMSFAEIADVVGSGESAVRSNLSRALATLRIQLSEAAPVGARRSTGES